jgi:acyl-CoA synthetase (AMP-forming)/AMP-acid ligase II
MSEATPVIAAPMSASPFAAAAASMTIDGVFRRAFDLFPDRIAVTGEDSAQTYGELCDRAWRLAGVLTALGLRRGGRIAVLSETRPAFVEIYAAAAALGVTVVALNIRLHPEEWLYCLMKGAPTLVVASEPLAPALETVRERAGGVAHWVSLAARHGWLDYERLLAESLPREPPRVAEPEDIHNVLFTSGTTGRPKGAMISQRAAAIRALRLAQWFDLGEKDGFVGWLPLYHCGGDESLYATMLTGGLFCALRKADPETMFRTIARDRLTWTLLLPGVLTDFLNHPRRREHDLSSLRFAIGYANMMPDIIAELTAALSIAFYDAFGQSESSYLLAHGVSGPGETPSLRKRPAPLMDVRIVDDAMNDCASGVAGECIVRGPSVMSGYLDDADANAEVFRGGWLHTGDLLRREADGALTFVDRKRYLIKTGGENVYPAEVEAVLARHPAVQEVCVFGVPDSHWGETIKAVVVARASAAVTAADISAFCRERLAGYKRPRYVEFVASERLPRSATGKLQRHELAKWPLGEDQKV